MEDFNRGLMASDAQQPTKRSPIFQQFMQALGPSKTDVPLEQRFAAMSDTERATLLTTSKMVRMAMQMKIAARDYSMGYADLLTAMYGQMSASKRRMIVELLDETAPLSFTPQPKQPRQSSSQSIYDRPEFNISSEPKATEDQTDDTLESVLADAFSTRQAQQKQATTFQSKDEFLAAMIPVAKEVADELGVSHKIILAPAALESGWGAKAKGNAFFGIKSHRRAGGQTFTTHEEVDGKRVKITDSFR